VSVETELGLAVQRQEIQPVPEDRQPIAMPGERIGTVQCRGQRRDGSGGHRVQARLGTSDPAAQLFDIDVHQTGK
jgi:hypothetical protein